jgi:hypothetical protein
MYSTTLERVCTKVILQKRPPVSLPTPPRIARSGDGVVPLPDARRCAMPHAVEGVPTQATLGWIPRSTCKKVRRRKLPAKRKVQEREAAEKDELGVSYRACR